jgi:hypothetical protein
MDKATLEALQKVVNYLYQSEAAHWQEAGCPDDHIYLYARKVYEWMSKEASAWKEF